MSQIACPATDRMQTSWSRHHQIELPFGRGVVDALEWSDEARLCPQPVVSVIMLTYAHEKYLAKAIEGVLAQQADFAIELIIGEDCSPDRSIEIALQYQTEHPDRIRVIRGQANVGARWNSYRCERLCRGTYVAYCEGDDWWHDPRKLRKQVEFLESHPECGLVYTNADTQHIVSGQRTPMAIPYRPELCEDEDSFLQQLTGAMIIWPLTACLRKALLDEITDTCPEITDKSFAMGDTPRYLEIARRSRIYYLPISTATRNLLPESMTQSQTIARRAKFVAGSAKVTLHYLDKYPTPERYDREIRRWVYLRELEYAYLSRDADRARRAFLALEEKRIPVPLRHRLYYHGTLNPVVRLVTRGFWGTTKALAAACQVLRPRSSDSEG